MVTKFLQTIPYSQFDLWDFKRYSLSKNTSKYKIDRLSKHIKHETSKIILSDFPEDIFDILGISNERGMEYAYSEKGLKFNQPYKIVKDGFISYNPYRINVGSIGIKSATIKGNLISPAYVVFSTCETLLPEYLFLLTKTKQFNSFVKENTSGSVRQILSFNALGKFRAPIPPIEIQQKLVDEYNSKMQIADSKLQDKNNYLISDAILQKLAIMNSCTDDYRKIFDFVAFSSISRWDIKGGEGYAKSALYKTLPFQRVLTEKPKYGANVKGVKKHSDTRYVRITDINEDGTLNDEFVSPEIVEEQYLLKENDFLIARSGNTVGKTFLYKNSYGRAIYAGYLVKYKINENIALPEYVFYYTKTKIFKQWISQNQRIAGQPNINGQEYLAFPLILPPIDVQKKIIEIASSILSEEQNIIATAEDIKASARENFEKAVFD